MLNAGREDIDLDKIGMALLRPESKVGTFLCQELEIGKETYLRFLHTLCIQAAYRVSTTHLFDSRSLLKDSTLMEREKYNEIWKMLSTKKKLKQNQMNSCRRATPLWESVQSIVNTILRSISVTNCSGRISIALDDNKIGCIYQMLKLTMFSI